MMSALDAADASMRLERAKCLHNARELADQFHSIKGLERGTTLIVNAATVSLSENQNYPMILLRMRWKIDELYVAVYELLGRGT